jgi:HK97 family phage prohead protease
MMMERKFTAIDDIEVAADQRSVKGYASVFGGIDSYRDTIIKGAYAASIKAVASRGLPMLYQHNPDQVIGRWTGLKEDDKGLIIEGVLTPEHSVANDVYASLKAGHVDGMSIGFSVPSGGASERSDGVRVLKKIDLKEVSIVTFPADHAARVDGVKAAELTEREFERLMLRAMRDAGAEFTRSDAIALMRGGYKSLIATRDAGGRLETEAEIKAALLDAIRSARS